jgi:hypothetical protein
MLHVYSEGLNEEGKWPQRGADPGASGVEGRMCSHIVVREHILARNAPGASGVEGSRGRIVNPLGRFEGRKRSSRGAYKSWCGT